MKASIFPLWWNPWSEGGIEFDNIKLVFQLII